MYAAALDLSKAIGSVNQLKFLLKTGLPVGVVTIKCNWFGKLLVYVRWNNVLPNAFQVGSSVRQGSMLSPALVNVSMNMFTLKLSGCGSSQCYVKTIWLWL